MSEFTVVMRRCDLTGEEAPADSEKIESVPFSFDGVDYDIDLVPAQAAALRDAFSDYIAHGRRTGRVLGVTRRTGGSSKPAAPTTTKKATTTTVRRDPEQTRAIRRWAREVGYVVGDKGRIPEDVAEHYREAGGKTAGVQPRRAPADQGANG